jgi:hypothetical protein
MAKCLPLADERVEHQADPISTVGLIGGRRRRHYDLHRTATAAAAKEIRDPKTVATAARSVISTVSIRLLVAFVTWTDGGFGPPAYDQFATTDKPLSGRASLNASGIRSRFAHGLTAAGPAAGESLRRALAAGAGGHTALVSSAGSPAVR